MNGSQQLECHVAMGFDENYAGAAVIAIDSIVRTLASGSLVLHVLTIDGVSTHTAARLNQVLRPSDELRIHSVTPTLSLSSRGGYWSDSAMLRVFISGIPKESGRLLYLDADILVREDIRNLLEVELGSCAIGAVGDPYLQARGTALRCRMRPDGSHAAVTPGSTDEAPDAPSYFNVGVLVVDLSRWRKRRVSELAVEMLTAYGNDMFFYDQDALNIILRSDWMPLAQRWNQLTGPSEQMTNITRGGILHFVGTEKPWEDDYPSGDVRSLYEAAAARGEVRALLTSSRAGAPLLGEPMPAAQDWRAGTSEHLQLGVSVLHELRCDPFAD